MSMTVIGLSIATSYWLWIESLILFDALYSALTGLIVFGHASFNKYFVTYKLKEQIKGQFKKYLSPEMVDELTKNLKEKNFSAVRKWTVDNLDNDPAVLLRRIYDALYSTLKNSSIPAAVLIIARYQYQIAFVADQEINLLAALTEIMVECEFK